MAQNYIFKKKAAFSYCFSFFAFVQIVSYAFRFVQNLSYLFKNDVFIPQKRTACSAAACQEMLYFAPKVLVFME